MFWAHSRCQPLNHSLAHHPQIGQRKHHQQLAGVLGQTPVSRPEPKTLLSTVSVLQFFLETAK
jgi:hypothetical protein